MKKLLTVILSTLVFLLIVLQFTFCKNISDALKNVTDDEIVSIAKEAYVYGFPMVVNYKTMYNYTLNEQSPEYKGRGVDKVHPTLNIC